MLAAPLKSENDPLLNVGELARLLRVSKKTIYYWVKRNEIPYLKIGKHLRFAMHSVVEFFETKTIERTPSCLRRLSQVEQQHRSLKTEAETKSESFASSKKE